MWSLNWKNWSLFFDTPNWLWKTFLSCPANFSQKWRVWRLYFGVYKNDPNWPKPRYLIVEEEQNQLFVKWDECLITFQEKGDVSTMFLRADWLSLKGIFQGNVQENYVLAIAFSMRCDRQLLFGTGKCRGKNRCIGKLVANEQSLILKRHSLIQTAEEKWHERAKNHLYPLEKL